MEDLTLNCWIRSEETRAIFKVKISNAETIDDLQNAIKNEDSANFRDVAAQDLSLYKPKDPVSEPYEDHLRRFILSEHAELLVGAQRLSVFFPKQPTEHDIHVIVDAPLKIVCWLRGTALNDRFDIPIRPGESIDQLRASVKDALPSLRDTENYLIRFYKIPRDENELRESLSKPGHGELLQSGQLAHNFLDMPVLDPLQVVVERPTEGAKDLKRKHERDDEEVLHGIKLLREFIAMGSASFLASMHPPTLSLREAFEIFREKCKENPSDQEIAFLGDREAPPACEWNPDRESQRSAVFTAIADRPGSRDCVVKFTGKYSEAAHRHLASHGLAPKILKCIRISAEWTAVVMEKSEYKILFGMSLSENEQEKVKNKVKKIVQTLHDGQFVHGDVRDVNLLIDYPSLASDDVTVHLIDFDWAGCTGKVRYPTGVNCKTVKRPEGVKGGELITEQHDDEMVSYLFQNHPD